MNIITILTEFAAYGQAGIFFGLIVVLIFMAKFFFKEYKKITIEHKSDITILKEKHEENHCNIINQMFEVISNNTEVIATNTETTRGLGDSIRDLRTVITIKQK